MNKNNTDRIFSTRLDQVAPFEFDENVVNVFDDMINRSVPFYRDIVSRQAQLAAFFYKPGTMIYDLGCSHGNFGMSFLEEIKNHDFRMTAIDNSEPMIDKYLKRIHGKNLSDRIKLVCSDIRDVEISNASAIVMNLTLQFLPVEHRTDFIKKIYCGLNIDGIFLITEKIHHRNEFIDQLEQKFYYSFKRENGYSELEISQKREALENVLVPETIEQHIERFESCGFTKVAIWHKWFNFCSFLCIR